MFDWSNEDGKVIVKLPFEIYFGGTGFLMVFSLILVLFMSISKWFAWAVALLPPGPLQEKLKTYKLYLSHMEKKEEEAKTAEVDAKKERSGRNEATGVDTGTNGSVETVAKSRVRSTVSVNKADCGVNGDNNV